VVPGVEKYVQNQSNQQPPVFKTYAKPETYIPEKTEIRYDTVDRPSHYVSGRKYEPIDVIQDWELDFCLGNALKYISRAGRKDHLTKDLHKAIWYLERKIKQHESN